MKITSIIIIIVLSFIKLTAQDFEKGYFINKKGEKIDCFIKNVDWLYNPERFEYKLNLDSEAKEASIQEVEEFGITDFSKFVKFEVLIDTSETDKVKLNQNKHP